LLEGLCTIYIPEVFKVENLATLHEFMRKRPFATLVSSGSTRLIATHLPTALKTGAAFWYENSNGLAEIAVNQRSA
jgi:predicted FMN-binding regulatory protein PaiB